jgi:hypothetical protein
MTAIQPRIIHLHPGFRAECVGCGDFKETTRKPIAEDWRDAHTCDPVARRRHALREYQARAAVAR